MRFRLQEMRKKAGFRSASAFAEAIGMPVGTYTNYEQGKNKLTLEMAWRFAEIFGCTLDELAGRDFHPGDGAQPPEARELAEIYQDANPQGRAAIMAVARSQQGMAPPSAPREMNDAV